ncbi:MAG: Gfo/Idh/MocA family protein [Candidatus Fervidibacter sp.]|uniref:Gfo/Idh/MocA family protein n=1 Tax=Candidatus Fervidibacter sp. TaxID=3100871 RepID=UPI00404B6EFE
MAERIKVCVLGLGWMGRVHCEAFASMKDKVSLFVASRDPNKAKEFSERFGAEGWFGSYDEPLRGEWIDVVDICLPHDLHLPFAVKALEAGKHVLTEKPMALNYSEAKVMVQKAREHGKFLAVAENMRTYAHCVKARQLVNDGAIGEPFFVQVNHFACYVPAGWRQPLASSGGGSLIDAGHHYVDLSVMLGGKVKTVFANTHRKTVVEIDGEDTAVIHLIYESGATGHLVTSFGMPGFPPSPLFIVAGNEGCVYYEPNGRGLVLHRKSSEPQVILPPPSISQRDWWEETIREGVRAFVNGFTVGKEEPLSAEEGLHDIAIVSAAYRSEQIGSPVEVDRD